MLHGGIKDGQRNAGWQFVAARGAPVIAVIQKSSALLSKVKNIFTRVSPLRYTEIGFTAWIIDVANVAAFLCQDKGNGMLKIYGVGVKCGCLHGRDTDS